VIRAPASVLVLLVSVAAPSRADFSTDFRVTNDPGASRTETDGGANVIVDDGFVMIVWSDDRDGDADLYFRERIGLTWQPEVPLVTGTSSSTHPAIGRFPGEVRVVFEDDRTGHPEIWMKRKVLGVWGPDSCLTCDAFESARPAIDYRGEQLVWEETKDGNREIYLRERSSETWGPEMRISDDPGESSHPSVATATGIDFDPTSGLGLPLVLVVWQDDRDGNLEIYSRHFDFDGWTEERRVTDDPANSRFPSCTADYLNCSDVVSSVHSVAWQDDRDGNDEIYLARGSSGSWIPETRLTVTAAPSRHPAAYASIHLGPGPFGLVACASPAVAWEEGTAIRYRDLGFEGTDAIVSDPGAQAGAPSLGLEHVDADTARTIVVVWEDGRDGNFEIYTDESQEDFRVTGAPELLATASGLVLGRIQPNPFVATTRFRIDLTHTSELDVRIVDAAGREVAALFRGTKPAGAHDFSWSGETAAGGIAASGTYFVVVRDAGGVAARRIVRLR
jgi:hypothetical protein